MVEKTVKRVADIQEELTVNEVLDGYPRGVIEDLKRHQESKFMLYTALGDNLSKSERREVARILYETDILDFIF